MIKNRKAKITFKRNDWKKISLPAKNMVKRMLFKDPSKRMSVKEALDNPWLQYHLGIIDIMVRVQRITDPQFIEVTKASSKKKHRRHEFRKSTSVSPSGKNRRKRRRSTSKNSFIKKRSFVKSKKIEKFKVKKLSPIKTKGLRGSEFGVDVIKEEEEELFDKRKEFARKKSFNALKEEEEE